MRDPMKDFEQAMKLGTMARFRLRAEVLLKNYDSKLTDDQRETLIRVASEPQADDWEYLQWFDRFFEDDGQSGLTNDRSHT